MTAGSELKLARERAGLSAHELSERTKIQLYKIKALENDDYAQLPQGIYLSGMVRAVAHEVAIDPEPIVERVRRERGKLPGDWEIPFAAPIQLYAGAIRDDDVPDIDDIPLLQRSHGDDPLEGFAAETEVGTAPLPRNDHGQVSTRRRAGFIVLLLAVVPAAAALGMYLGETRPNNVTRTADLRQGAGSKPPPATATFSENVITTEAESDKPSHADPSVSAQDNAGTSDTVGAPAPSAPVAGNAPPITSQAVEPTPPAVAPAQPDRIQTPPASTDVTGSWRLATQIESSSYSRYTGLELDYDLELEQSGDRVTGTGRKVRENGAGIGRRAQTPVTVSGTIAGDRLTLTFVERGARRPTQGKFVLMVDGAGTLRGRFSSTAARSSGRVEAHRVSAQ